MERVDYLIAGDGLAGLLTAWHLLKAGHSIRVWTGPKGRNASRVAAGVLNPVTGRRLVASPGVEEQLQHAGACYRQLEQDLGRRFFRSLPIRRFGLLASELSFYEKRWRDHRYRQLLGPWIEAGCNSGGWDDPLGSFYIPGAAHLEIPELLDGILGRLRELGSLLEGPLPYSEIILSKSEVIVRGRFQASALICCEGAGVLENPFFRWLPLRPVKGEVLDLALDLPSQPEEIVHHRKWLLHAGDGVWRLGSTYHKHHPASAPSTTPSSADGEVTSSGREELLGALRQMRPDLGVPRVLAQRAGIRPATRDRQPMIGPHPRFPRLFLLNGLGSKGALYAPAMCRYLVEHLLRGAAIPPVYDLRRFEDEATARNWADS